MVVLDSRWPTPALPRSAPGDWDILLLYMLGQVADELYRCGCKHLLAHERNMQLWHMCVPALAQPLGLSRAPGGS